MSEIPHFLKDQKRDGESHSPPGQDIPSSSCVDVETLLTQERRRSAELKDKITELEKVVLAQRVQLEEENNRLRKEMSHLAELLVKKSES